MQLPKIHISVSTAIRSRAQIFEVKPLTEADIHVAIQRALTDKEKGLGALASISMKRLNNTLPASQTVIYGVL